jgi:hypothetical protein
VLVGSERMGTYDEGAAEELRAFDGGVAYRAAGAFGEYSFAYRRRLSIPEDRPHGRARGSLAPSGGPTVALAGFAIGDGISAHSFRAGAEPQLCPD